MEEILQMLRRDRDAKYAVFQQKLIPTLPLENFIGVRTPQLRRLAKQLVRTPKLREAFWGELPHVYYDENQLHFFSVCEMTDFEECMTQVERFLPYVNNWSTCDQPFPKVFEKHVKELSPYVEKWLESGETYTVRFGIGTAMRLFLEERGERRFDRALLEKISQIRSEEYYVNMMIAWYFATALAKQWESAIRILEERKLEAWVHNKTIQKARESCRITQEQKAYLAGLRLKRKESGEEREEHGTAGRAE